MQQRGCGDPPHSQKRSGGPRVFFGGLDTLSLAYALTVHKAQGSQYDTVLMPISMEMYGMLSRNLLYTAISRAKKEFILFGDMQALDVAVQKRLPQRKSMLAAKTRMLLEKCAGMWGPFASIFTKKVALQKGRRV